METAPSSGMFNTQPSEKRLSLCKGIIKQKLSKMNCVNDRNWMSTLTG